MKALIGTTVEKIDGDIWFFERVLQRGVDLIAYNIKTSQTVSCYALTDYYKTHKEELRVKLFASITICTKTLI